jgi:hypothetical protein
MPDKVKLRWVKFYYDKLIHSFYLINVRWIPIFKGEKKMGLAGTSGRTFLLVHMALFRPSAIKPPPPPLA